MAAIGAVLLAAGGSSRMGQAKQLLTYRGQTLLRRAACAALDAGCSPLIVVLGADEEKFRREVADLGVELLVHEQWERGMGSSLRAGVQRALHSRVNLDGLIVMLCDQPLVDSRMIRALLESNEKNHSLICAAAYAGTVGPPCLFSSAMFPELLGLPDGGGAKSIILRHMEQTVQLAMDAAGVDVDTAEDFQKLLDREGA
jgi:molybdenum cofactor cytidylyltransferase